MLWFPRAGPIVIVIFLIDILAPLSTETGLAASWSVRQPVTAPIHATSRQEARESATISSTGRVFLFQVDVNCFPLSEQLQ